MQKSGSGVETSTATIGRAAAVVACVAAAVPTFGASLVGAASVISTQAVASQTKAEVDRAR